MTVPCPLHANLSPCRNTLTKQGSKQLKTQLILQEVYIYVPLSHLRSKGKASAYILYCTGSGMLTRYTHYGQCNTKNIALTTVRISRYSIPKSPKNHQIPLMQPLTACLFI